MITIRTATTRALVAFCVLVCCYAVVTALWLTYDLRSSMFFSDYESVLRRYAGYHSQSLSLADFVLTKQVDHNHALVYLLGLLDIRFLGGRQLLLTWSTVIANVGFFAGMLMLIWRRAALTTVQAVAMSCMVASMTFSPLGGETWFFPFQCVLTTFRLLLMATLLAFAILLAEPPQRRRPLLASATAGMALVCAACHGSGMTLLALFTGVAALGRRWRLTVLFGLALAVQLVFERAHPSQSPLQGHEVVEQLAAHVDVLLKNIPGVLGFFAAYGTEYTQRNKVLGVLAIVAYAVAAWHVWQAWRAGQASPLRLMAALWGAFALLGAAMSVASNVAYAEVLGANIHDPAHYVASRYMVTMSGFWIATALLWLMQLNARADLWRRGAAAAVCALLVLSAGNVWQRGVLMVPIWAEKHRQLRTAEAMVEADVGELVPGAQIGDRVGLPGWSEDAIRSYVATSRRFALGPFAAAERQRIERIAAHPEESYVGAVSQLATTVPGVLEVRGIIEPEAGRPISSRPFPVVDARGEVIGIAVVDDPGSCSRGLTGGVRFVGYSRTTQPVAPLRVVAPAAKRGMARCIGYEG